MRNHLMVNVTGHCPPFDRSFPPQLRIYGVHCSKQFFPTLTLCVGHEAMESPPPLVDHIPSTLFSNVSIRVIKLMPWLCLIQSR